MAGLLILAGSGAGGGAAAQEWRVARSDIATVLGYYGISNGSSHRRLATAWGNTSFENGLGSYAEMHFINREEAAAYFAGGLSLNGKFGELRGWIGTST